MSRSSAATIEAANTTLIVDGRFDAAEDFFTPDYVAHLTGKDLTGGPAGVRRFVSMLHAAFSSLAVQIDILVESDDRIAWQRTVSGTHTGPFSGFPATGKRIVWRDMLVSRIEQGCIAEEWAVSDLAERLLLARKV